jgi:hypothetical protein
MKKIIQVLLGSLLIISACVNIYLSFKILDLQNIINSNQVDSTPINEYLNRTTIAYNKADWNAVTLNASFYERKTNLIKEPITPPIYLYTSYAYYNIGIKLKDKQRFTEFDKGLQEVEKYLKLENDKHMIYFVKGLILINYDDKNYITNLEQGVVSFQQADKCVIKNNESTDQSVRIKHHIGVAYERMALYYRDKIKNKQKTKESFEEARKAYDLINETASVARIDKYISQ